MNGVVRDSRSIAHNPVRPAWDPNHNKEMAWPDRMDSELEYTNATSIGTERPGDSTIAG